jgi:hypothetical protein
MRITLFLFLSGISNCLFSQSDLYREKIPFPYKSEKITSESLKKIKAIWDRLPVNTSVELILVSDKEIRKLDPGIVVALSVKRTEEVRLFLTTQKMIRYENIEVNKHSYIEIQEMHGTTASFKRKVRDPYKVHSVILNKDIPICDNHTAAELRALTSKEPNVFTIDPATYDTLNGRDRVVVEIPANAFNLPEDKKDKKVTVTFWEFVHMDDMMMAGLSTSSQGRLLETGGMIYIMAECDGICLKLLRDKNIKVKFPIFDDRKDSMRLFKGIPHREIVDWKKTNNKDQSLPGIPDTEIDSGAVSYYILYSSGLGWINCDRLLGAGKRIDVSYTSAQDFVGVAGLIFTDIKSILQGDFSTAKINNIHFSNVPEGSEATLLVFTQSKDGKKIFYYMEKVIIGSEPGEIKVKEASPEEFKEELRKFMD